MTSSDTFSLAARLLEDAFRPGEMREPRSDSAHAIPHQASADAVHFLAQLRYIVRDGKGHGYRSTASSAEAGRNRVALLRLAAQFERIFRLPIESAPNVVFLAGEIDPARFGLWFPELGILSVGGCGPTLQSAFERCVGEAAERLSALEWGDEPLYRVAADHGGRLASAPGTPQPVSNPDHLHWMLMGIGAGAEAAPDLDWIVAETVQSGDACLLPADIALRRRSGRGPPGARPAGSNGCAAAPSDASAIHNGLLEVVERDAIALWWYGGSPAGAVRLDGRARQRLDRFADAVRAGSRRPHHFLDLTQIAGLPVSAAVSAAPDGTAVALGFGAGGDLADAAERALLEMCQIELAYDIVHLKLRDRKPEDLNPMDRCHLERFQRLDLRTFPQLTPGTDAKPGTVPVPDPTAAPLDVALAAAARAGLSVLAVDLRRETFGVSTKRVLIPGLQSPNLDWQSNRLNDELTNLSQLSIVGGQLPRLLSPQF